MRSCSDGDAARAACPWAAWVAIGVAGGLAYAALGAVGGAWAQPGSGSAVAKPSEPLAVAVREVPPFALRNDRGEWEGLSVDLWREVAKRGEIAFEWHEATLSDTLDGLRSGEIDVAIAAISVNSARESFMDFSHPYYVTGLSRRTPRAAPVRGSRR